SASRARRNHCDRDAHRTRLSMVKGGDIDGGQVPRDNFTTLGLRHMVADGTVAARRRPRPRKNRGVRMRRCPANLVFVIVLTCVAETARAQSSPGDRQSPSAEKPNFTGSWVLNTELSDTTPQVGFGGAPDTSGNERRGGGRRGGGVGGGIGGG